MKIKILYIDDEPNRRHRSVLAMERAGFTVLAPQGNTTVELKNNTIDILKEKKHQFEVFITDINHGDQRLGGLKLYREIENDFAHRWKDLLFYTMVIYTGTKKELNELTEFLFSRGFNPNNIVGSESELIQKIKNLQTTND